MLDVYVFVQSVGELSWNKFTVMGQILIEGIGAKLIKLCL